VSGNGDDGGGSVPAVGLRRDTERSLVGSDHGEEEREQNLHHTPECSLVIIRGQTKKKGERTRHALQSGF